MRELNCIGWISIGLVDKRRKGNLKLSLATNIESRLWKDHDINIARVWYFEFSYPIPNAVHETNYKSLFIPGTFAHMVSFSYIDFN